MDKWEQRKMVGNRLDPENRISTENKIRYLKEAKALIPTPNKWVRSYYAKLKNGESTKNLQELHDGDCVAYCLYGAVLKVLQSDSLPALGITTELRKTIKSELGLNGWDNVSINEFNDANEHSDVINIIDLTIERLQENV